MPGTPVCDFIEQYRGLNPARFHMPGHKGKSFTGPEACDITEITGADELFHADGILLESELNASALFGSGRTLYSAEGSSLCIRSMLYMALLLWKERTQTAPFQRPTVLAGRNAHKSFLSAAALLDLDVEWLWPGDPDDRLCACTITAKAVEDALRSMKTPPCAVYITAPDYLGNLTELKSIAAAAHAAHTLLLVDNAHGAYLKFLKESLHPMDLDADICCDSAHKTLPALTGGAYLHISPRILSGTDDYAAAAMQLFASTSPSYLILQSLDRVNRYLSGEYPQRLEETVGILNELKTFLSAIGYNVLRSEPLKLTVSVREWGWTGTWAMHFMEERGIFPEYADPDYLVLMASPENTPEDFKRLREAFTQLDRKQPLKNVSLPVWKPERALSVREAAMLPFETIPSEAAEGRIAALSAVTCPPAVSVVTGGEIVNAAAVRVCAYYGIHTLTVVKGDPHRN